MTTGVEFEADRAQIVDAVGEGTAAREPQPYGVVFDAAMARIASLSRSWQDGSGAVAGVDLPSPRPGSAATIPLAVVGDATGALAARARAPRWRRRLAS
jgi:hypothetical protein